MLWRRELSHKAWLARPKRARCVAVPPPRDMLKQTRMKAGFLNARAEAAEACRRQVACVLLLSLRNSDRATFSCSCMQRDGCGQVGRVPENSASQITCWLVVQYQQSPVQSCLKSHLALR
jgi:hypothetical protein